MIETGVSGVNSVTSTSEMTVVPEINIVADGTEVTGAVSLSADILSGGECSSSTVLAVCRWCLGGGSLSQLLPTFCNLVRATFGMQVQDFLLNMFVYIYNSNFKFLFQNFIVGKRRRCRTIPIFDMQYMCWKTKRVLCLSMSNRRQSKQV